MDATAVDTLEWDTGTVDARILLIEDDHETADEVVKDLTDRGYDVTHIDGGKRGLTAARDDHFSLMIVDRMLPELDGLSVIEALRKENIRIPARVAALLRRPTDSRETMLRVGPLELDLIDRVARRKSREIELLPREFKLLEYLMRRPCHVVTRDMLLEDVWHYKFSPQTNLVDVHIGKLRRKVDADGEIPLLYNVRGVGFILRVPD
jgi:two-component system, OmpR family, response regulator